MLTALNSTSIADLIACIGTSAMARVDISLSAYAGRSHILRNLHLRIDGALCNLHLFLNGLGLPLGALALKISQEQVAEDRHRCEA